MSIAHLINWQKCVSHRTPDVIPDIPIFLTKILFLDNRPILTEYFWLSVIEEASRRAMQRNLLEPTKLKDNRAYIAAVLAASPLQQNFMGEKQDNYTRTDFFRSSMEIALNKAKVSTRIETKTPDESDKMSKDIPKVDSTVYIVTPEMKQLISWHERDLQPILHYIKVIQAIITNKVDIVAMYEKISDNVGIVWTEHVEAFAELNLLSYKKDQYTIAEFFHIDMLDNDINKQIYVMILQNTIHLHSTTLSDALKDNTYINPFTTDSYVLIQMGVNVPDSWNTNTQPYGYSYIFKCTKDILVAAGIIRKYCKGPGDVLFDSLLTHLKDSTYDIPLHKKKIGLLVNGEYQGVRLYGYKCSVNKITYKWSPSWKNQLCLMKANKLIVERTGGTYDMTDDMWLKEVFRWKESSYGADMTIRSPGEFPKIKIRKQKKEKK
jgi:hypothetical protein